MHTWIYKGNRKEHTYLFVTEKDNFNLVPDALLVLLGPLELVLHVELTAERRLAQADAHEVRLQLETEGFFLQMPPGDKSREMPC